jgi:hypothetical protein
MPPPKKVRKLTSKQKKTLTLDEQLAIVKGAGTKDLPSDVQEQAALLRRDKEYLKKEAEFKKDIIDTLNKEKKGSGDAIAASLTTYAVSTVVTMATVTVAGVVLWKNWASIGAAGRMLTAAGVGYQVGGRTGAAVGAGYQGWNELMRVYDDYMLADVRRTDTEMVQYFLEDGPELTQGQRDRWMARAMSDEHVTRMDPEGIGKQGNKVFEFQQNVALDEHVLKVKGANGGRLPADADFTNAREVPFEIQEDGTVQRLVRPTPKNVSSVPKQVQFDSDWNEIVDDEVEPIVEEEPAVDPWEGYEDPDVFVDDEKGAGEWIPDDDPRNPFAPPEDIVAPEVGIPEVGIPEVGIPEVGIPEVGIPDVPIPDVPIGGVAPELLDGALVGEEVALGVAEEVALTDPALLVASIVLMPVISAIMAAKRKRDLRNASNVAWLTDNYDMSKMGQDLGYDMDKDIDEYAALHPETYSDLIGWTLVNKDGMVQPVQQRNYNTFYGEGALDYLKWRTENKDKLGPHTMSVGLALESIRDINNPTRWLSPQSAEHNWNHVDVANSRALRESIADGSRYYNKYQKFYHDPAHWDAPAIVIEAHNSRYNIEKKRLDAKRVQDQRRNWDQIKDVYQQTIDSDAEHNRTMKQIAKDMKDFYVAPKEYEHKEATKTGFLSHLMQDKERLSHGIDARRKTPGRHPEVEKPITVVHNPGTTTGVLYPRSHVHANVGDKDKRNNSTLPESTPSEQVILNYTTKTNKETGLTQSGKINTATQPRHQFELHEYDSPMNYTSKAVVVHGGKSGVKGDSKSVAGPLTVYEHDAEQPISARRADHGRHTGYNASNIPTDHVGPQQDPGESSHSLDRMRAQYGLAQTIPDWTDLISASSQNFMHSRAQHQQLWG